MKEFQIAGVTIKNRYVLAPMAGYTDYSMRHMCSEYGSGLNYSEMESCESLIYNSQATIEDLESTKLDKQNHPDVKLALQVFGGKPDVVLKSIPLFEKYADYDFLDFNTGCPVPKVIKQHAGAYWLKRQDELIDMLREMVKISSKPVIVKIRIGFECVYDVVPMCKRMEEVGVQAIAVHGRTKDQVFSGEVRYDVIKDIKDNLHIPVIANGDINADNAQNILDITGADALMIGQHSIGYPRIFKDLVDLEEGREREPRTLSNQIDDLKEHLETIFSFKDERSASGIMRGISVRYLKGFDNTAEIRRQLVKCQTLQEYLDILETMQNEQNSAQIA